MAHSVRLPLPSGERAGVRGTTMERWQRLSPAEVDLSASAELLNVRNWTSCDVCQRRGGTSNRPFPLPPTLSPEGRGSQTEHANRSAAHTKQGRIIECFTLAD